MARVGRLKSGYGELVRGDRALISRAGLSAACFCFGGRMDGPSLVVVARIDGRSHPTLSKYNVVCLTHDCENDVPVLTVRRIVCVGGVK